MQYHNDRWNVFYRYRIDFVDDTLNAIMDDYAYMTALSNYYDELSLEIKNMTPSHVIKGFNDKVNTRNKLLKNNKNLILNEYQMLLVKVDPDFKGDLKQFMIKIINNRMGINNVNDRQLSLPSLTPTSNVSSHNSIGGTKRKRKIRNYTLKKKI